MKVSFLKTALLLSLSLCTLHTTSADAAAAGRGEKRAQKAPGQYSQKEFNEFLTAVNNGPLESVEYFVDNNLVDVNSIDKKSGDRPLHVAVRAGYLDVVEALVQGSANTSLRDRHHQTPLELAEDIAIEDPDFNEILHIVDFLREHEPQNVGGEDDMSEETDEAGGRMTPSPTPPLPSPAPFQQSPAPSVPPTLPTPSITHVTATTTAAPTPTPLPVTPISPTASTSTPLKPQRFVCVPEEQYNIEALTQPPHAFREKSVTPPPYEAPSPEASHEKAHTSETEDPTHETPESHAPHHKPVEHVTEKKTPHHPPTPAPARVMGGL